ncbi:hypothetical protein J7M23_01495 [Candidatus Sumerlaeota bacterium]|nr:hypothetical protein [Candidatus Sumerlaeota bacterium]
MNYRRNYCLPLLLVFYFFFTAIGSGRGSGTGWLRRCAQVGHPPHLQPQQLKSPLRRFRHNLWHLSPSR